MCAQIHGAPTVGTTPPKIEYPNTGSRQPVATTKAMSEHVHYNVLTAAYTILRHGLTVEKPPETPKE
eukprot:3997398-Amphidinium_carterae.1